jgi:hypothetical protein
MNEQIMGHFKIWGMVFLAELTAWNLEDFHIVASIVVKICGAIGSLALAYQSVSLKRNDN